MGLIERTVTLTRGAATTGLTDAQLLLSSGVHGGHIRRLTVREDLALDKGTEATVYVTKVLADAAHSTTPTGANTVHSVAAVVLAGSATVASSDEKIVDQKASFPQGYDLYIHADITAVGASAAVQTVLYVTALMALED